MADIHILVADDSAGQRLDAYLGANDGCPTRSACAHLIEGGAVIVNGETCLSKKYAVRSGDRISVDLPEPHDPTDVIPEAIPLDIRYEDDYLIVLSKQRGLVCHPAHGHESGTLANALVYHCGIDHLGTVQGEDRPGIVHRLDRDTSGLMLAAKDDDTQRALQNLIRTRTLDRRYITLVHGHIAMDEGTINTGIAVLRVTVSRWRFRTILSRARPLRPLRSSSASIPRVLTTAIRSSSATCLRAATHQIRVHMRHINHACVGDPLYGKCDARADQGLTRQFLHSWRVAFDHPVTGERIECATSYRGDLAAVLDDLAPRSLGRTAAGDEIVPQLGLLEA